jgi:glycosyltransferase involved in cell wall biosynthesis
MMQQKHGDKFQLTDLGYDHRRFNADPMSPELQEKWNNDLVFIGHHEKRTEAAILALIDAGVNVQVYGHGPWFRSKNSDRLAPHLKERLSNEDYESALKGAKIGFCSHSEWNYNQTAARSFEIPASGTFLLALRSQRHQEFYKEGEEAEFFLNHDELVRKTKHYLAHSEEREKIAAAGHRRAVDGGYSWDAIMKRDWEKVLVAYNSQKK